MLPSYDHESRKAYEYQIHEYYRLSVILVHKMSCDVVGCFPSRFLAGFLHAHTQDKKGQTTGRNLGEV